MRCRSQESSSWATGAHASRRQTAQSGSIPRSSRGTHTSSASASTRSASAPMSSGETNGISQATIATSGSRAAVSELAMPRMAPADPQGPPPHAAPSRQTRTPQGRQARWDAKSSRLTRRQLAPATQHALDQGLATKRHARLVATHARRQPPAWTTQERSARLTVVIRQNTPIGMLETRCTKLNTVADKAGGTANPCKNKTAPLRHAARPRAQKRW